MKKIFVKLIKPLLNNLWMLLGLYASIIGLATLGYSFFEKKPLTDALWWSFVTIMTVGYGDMYPATAGGRIVAVLLMHLGIYVVAPMIIALIITHVLIDNNEFTQDEQDRLINQLQETRDIIVNNTFTEAEQAELRSLMTEMKSVLAEIVPIVKQIQEQTDGDEGDFGTERAAQSA